VGPPGERQIPYDRRPQPGATTAWTHRYISRIAADDARHTGVIGDAKATGAFRIVGARRGAPARPCDGLDDQSELGSDLVRRLPIIPSGRCDSTRREVEWEGAST